LGWVLKLGRINYTLTLTLNPTLILNVSFFTQTEGRKRKFSLKQLLPSLIFNSNSILTIALTNNHNKQISNFLFREFLVCISTVLQWAQNHFNIYKTVLVLLPDTITAFHVPFWLNHVIIYFSYVLAWAVSIRAGKKRVLKNQPT